MITEKELQEITEKYSYYLSQARIDIARSQAGKVYFIEFDKYNKYKRVILELNRTINEANVYINPYILYELAFLNNLYQYYF